MTQGHKDSSGSLCLRLFPHHHVRHRAGMVLGSLGTEAQEAQRVFYKKINFSPSGIRSLIFLAQALGGSQLC